MRPVIVGFCEAFILVPRKNGKSPLAAAIGLYMLVADGEVGAEVYTGATSEKLAWEVFRPARLMAVKTPDLRKVLGVEVNAKSLIVESTGSRFEPVIGKPGDGASPSCAIADEFHEADSAALYDTFKTGMIGRTQPLLLVISGRPDSRPPVPCHDLQLSPFAACWKEQSLTSSCSWSSTRSTPEQIGPLKQLYGMANPNSGTQRQP